MLRLALPLYRLVMQTKGITSNRADLETWRTDIFPSALVMVLAFSFLAFLFYYYFLGMKSASYNKAKHWTVTGGVTAILSSLASLVMPLTQVTFSKAIVPPLVIFWGHNLLYTFVLFFLFSMIGKWWSLHSSQSPF